jgi:hypothetical protein
MDKKFGTQNRNLGKMARFRNTDRKTASAATLQTLADLSRYPWRVFLLHLGLLPLPLKTRKRNTLTNRKQGMSAEIDSVLSEFWYMRNVEIRRHLPVVSILDVLLKKSELVSIQFELLKNFKGPLKIGGYFFK